MNLVQYKTAQDIPVDKIEEILKMYEDGCADVEICKFLKISVVKFAELRRKDKDFAELIELGKTYGMAWWTRTARYNVKNKDFNCGTWMGVMKNRYEYIERSADLKGKAIPGWKEADVLHNMRLLNKLVEEGKISDSSYASKVKTLAYQAKIYEIMEVVPKIRKMELDHKLDRGEITKKEHELYMQEVMTASDEYATKVVKQYALSDGRAGDSLLLENGEVQKARRKRTVDNKKRKPKVYKMN